MSNPTAKSKKLQQPQICHDDHWHYLFNFIYIIPQLCSFLEDFQSFMLVQEISKAPTGPPKKAARGSALYGRTALDSSAQQSRINRHLTELEQDNYHAIQIDIPKSESPLPSSQKLMIAPRKQHKLTPNVRKLLTTRKTLTNLLDEAGFAADVYRDAAVKPGVYPPRTFCSVCGYWGKYGCMKCGDRYCGEACAETHRGTNA